MSRFLIELKIGKISFEAEELHLILNSREKTFLMPCNVYSFDIQSTTSPLAFEFYLKSKVVFQGKLNPLQEFSKFTDEKQKIVEFYVSLQELFHPKAQNLKKSLENLQRTVKTCKISKHKLDFAQDSDFFSVFQGSFCDQSESQYIKYLETIIIGLASKVKSYQFSTNYKVSMLESGSRERELKKNSNEFFSFSNKTGESDPLLAQIESLKKSNLELLGQVRSGAVTEEKLSQENKTLSGELMKLKTDSRNTDSLSKNVKELQGLLIEKDRALENLKSKFIQLKQEQENVQKSFETSSQEAIGENQRLARDLLRAQEKIRDLESKQERVIQENNSLQQELQREKTCFKSIEKLSKFENTQKTSQVTQDLLHQIEDLKKLTTDITQQFNQEKQELLNKVQELETRLISKQKAENRRINQETKLKFSQSLENSQASSKLLFEKLLQDCKFSSDSMKEIDYKSIFENSSIYEHSEKISRKLLEYSHTIYYYQGIITSLVEVMRELKSENFALRERLFFAQNALPLYIPVRGDPLDFAMAEFVNNLRRPLKIPFVRQDPGFYLFGTRNIRIKILNNKPFIFAPEPGMPIDEYVNKYTRGEMQKLEEHKKTEEARLALEVSKAPFNESVFSTSPLTPSLSSSRFSSRRTNSNLTSVDSTNKILPNTVKAFHAKQSSLCSTSRVFKRQ